MRFTKMHGLGNDYVYVNGFEENISDPAALAQVVADRHTGIGGDGLILILPSQHADVRMRMFNADGSESEMCGNGVRCVAKYAYDHGLTRSNPMRVETGHGVLTLALTLVADKVRQVAVNMGAPILDPLQIPVNLEKLSRGQRVTEYRVPLEGETFDASFVSMGNPHAVIFTNDVSAIQVANWGPQLERHEAFPRRMNVHWAQVHSPNEITLRTWERGSGITMACGTGACAVAVAGVMTERTGRRVLAHLPGGDLDLEWTEKENAVYMTGPAVEVFSGEWELK